MKMTFTNIKRAVGFCAALMMLTAINAQNARADNPSVQITSQPEPFIHHDGQNQKIYLKVGLRGTKPDFDEMQRPPINLALVLDKSGSMSGQKIEDVKQAAKAMIDRLQSGDTISIIIYDDRSQVLVPTTHLENAELIRQRIDSITGQWRHRSSRWGYGWRS
ncbi:MAG: VWA domain-containing protein [Alphaproteobacteria bacterium]|nr:VWA domain-containing protein [Alphaproteobacteria bacterium]